MDKNNINREEYLIAFGYAFLAYMLISEPFVYQFTNYEWIRMLGLLMFMIGTIILTKLLNNSSISNNLKKGGDK